MTAVVCHCCHSQQQVNNQQYSSLQQLKVPTCTIHHTSCSPKETNHQFVNFAPSPSSSQQQQLLTNMIKNSYSNNNIASHENTLLMITNKNNNNIKNPHHDENQRRRSFSPSNITVKNNEQNNRKSTEQVAPTFSTTKFTMEETCSNNNNGNCLFDHEYLDLSRIRMNSNHTDSICANSTSRINIIAKTTTLICENVAYRKEQIVNYEQQEDEGYKSSPTTSGRIRAILIFTYLIFVYYLLLSTVLDTSNNNNNNINPTIATGRKYQSFLLVNGEEDLLSVHKRGSPRLVFASYPVTCSPYPPANQLQILSAGLPTSGALGNGTFLTVPNSSSFATMYIVTEPWLVVFPSLNTRSKTGRTTRDKEPNEEEGKKPNEPPRTVTDDDTIRVRKVATSYTHTVVIGDEEKSTKYLFGFGLNENNSLGISTELNQSVMVDPNDDDDVLDLDKSSSIVPELVKKDIRKKPNKIPSSTQSPAFNDIADVFVGDGFTVVLTKNEKQLFTIGRNNKYQLGIESKTSTWTQLPFKNITLIDTGSDHTAFIQNGYIGAFFGSNANLQMGNATLKFLGSGQSIPISKTFVPLQFDLRYSQIVSEGAAKPKKALNIVDVQASRYFTLMLTDEGSLVFFGQLDNAFKFPNLAKNSVFSDIVSFGGVQLSLNNIGRFKDSFNNVKSDSKFEVSVTAYYSDRLHSVSKILACDRFFVVLFNNNTVWISDNSFRGISTVGLVVDTVFSSKYISKMVCGRRHLVFLMSDNSAYAVGSNYYGQLGVKTVSFSSKLILLRTDVIDIEAGDFSTFLVANQSKLYAFGMNNMGQLGVTNAKSSRSSRSEFADSSQDSFAIVDFTGYRNYSISAGPYQSFIMSFNGTFAAGLNYNNMFGVDGSPEKLYIPTYISSLKSPVRAICSTLQNAFTIRDSTSELIMLGQSGYIAQSPPYGMPPKGVTNISCGAYHILATDEENNLYSAGYNANGQLGVGNEINYQALVKVNWDTERNGRIFQTSCGAKHSLVLTDKGAFAFGDNTYGQLGISGIEKSSSPLKIPVDNPAGVYAGFYHSHIITKNGTVFSFGRNDYQQLGPIYSSTYFVSTPTFVNLPYSRGGIVDIKPGAFHSLMLTATGIVYAFGNNDYGQLGFSLDKSVTSAELNFGTYNSPRIALSIDAGAFHSLILTSPYTENICPSISCNGVARNSASVCSRNGTCSANNLCLCNYGYAGDYCQYYSCFGTSSASPTVCSGQGACIGIDQCSCLSNATGTYCQNSANSDTDLALSIALPLSLSFVMLLVLGFIFLAISLALFFKKEKKKKLEERETSSGTESVNNNNKTDLESNLTLSVDKNFELNLVGTPVSGSDPYSTKSGNIRTFLNISQVSTAITLTKSMMDDYSGNNIQLSSNASQNRLGGGESMLIDRFVNLMKIGEGSFGLVFKGQDTKQNNQWKAIKLIRFSDLNELNQTLREATHLLRMVHPHIVRVNDVFIDANQHMLCMEMDYYELGDFEQFINNQCYLGQTVLPEPIVSQIIYQICSSLDYMNSEYNMIHRDVKPSNIFIKSFDYHRSQIHIVLGDFGLAKKGRNSISAISTTDGENATRISDNSGMNLSQALITGDANTLLSTHMGFAGTPIYMSWEAIVQGKNCFQTDIFALGVTAYQCLTGDRQTCITQLYLKEHQRRQLDLKLMSSEKDVEDLVRENIVKCSPNCSIELVDLVMQMLKKNPEDRPKPNEVINSQYFANKK